ncbi:MAG: 50S ribosomal protein L4 [Cyclobacteriaceae bacterium]|nr:50S ribosomal protein L4 [Cyclobacteriaceae bacterium]MCK5280296.1 50S ribosomal protein L4 [Cyclobacteriaceae bacterium]MCK5368575.1 50S ribosomal protein L4 [Cyclobacteriaceae bacterium]MCK5470262.1 50S ribosomal protein L4 [Cyclobacteriaceae bacterium]
MNIAILNIKGEDTGRKAKLNDKVFKIEPNDHAIYLVVKQYLAKQRQGTHKSKERAEIIGSTKKIKRQKGTGTARMGSVKSPLLRGGGRAFGPRPRDYGFKLNKKVKSIARKSVLSYKIQEKDLTVVENFSLDNPKTKSYLEILNSLSLTDKKTLMVIPESDKNIVLSGRNIPKAKVALASDINTYDVLNADKLILCEGSIEKIESILN